jgi:cytochrome c biogenesis protein CcmG/thiol:disulfide interchange protein DsbE
MRVAALAAVACALVAGCGSDEPKSASPGAAATRKALVGSPAPLAALHRQANRLLPGGADAFKKRLAELKGYPVVVNKWASWCGPCRAEFPHFQRLALRHGKRIGFLGVNSNDNDGAAAKFLKEYPVAYPSYKDPNLKVAAVFKGVVAFPSTAFYDSGGKLAYLKQGYYRSERDLEADLDRYAK